MLLQFYKSSKTIKGCAAGFSFNDKDGCLFISLIKQTGYDESKRLGTFSDGEQIVVKFSVTEIGALLDTLDSNKEYSTFHKAKKGNTSIKFAPYFVGEPREQKGFGLSIGKLDENNKVASTFLMPFNSAEAKVIRTYLDFVLRQIFHVGHLEQKQKYTASLKPQLKTVAKTVEKKFRH